MLPLVIRGLLCLNGFLRSTILIFEFSPSSVWKNSLLNCEWVSHGTNKWSAVQRTVFIAKSFSLGNGSNIFQKKWKTTETGYRGRHDADRNLLPPDCFDCLVWDSISRQRYLYSNSHTLRVERHSNICHRHPVYQTTSVAAAFFIPPSGRINIQVNLVSAIWLIPRRSSRAQWG